MATSLSVAVMILSVCIAGGFKSTIRQKIYSFWGHVLLVSYNENPANIISPKPIEYDVNLLHALQQNPMVQTVAPFIVRPAIIQSKGQMEGLRLKGIDANYILQGSINLKGKSISFADTAYSKEIIISQTTANKMLLQIGDDVLFYFLENGASMPRIRKMKVSGIYHTGMEDVDQYLAICDMRLLQHINNWTTDQINGYQIFAKKESDVSVLADTLFNTTDLTPQTITDTFPGIMDWLSVQDLSVRILLVIMAIVAMISLGAALIILIVERAAITGLLKALGMTNAGTQKIFLYIALLTACSGVVIGNTFALALCAAQQRWGFLSLSETTYFMSKVPIQFNWLAILLVDAFTVIITVVCMWLPTLYVRRMQPARVLRFK